MFFTSTFRPQNRFSYDTRLSNDDCESRGISVGGTANEASSEHRGRCAITSEGLSSLFYCLYFFE